MAEPEDRQQIKVILAQPRGFCAGVVRAIDIVERALSLYGPPVYVRHEIVHNKHVVETLRAKGAVFVKEVDEIPSGAVTVFSAHGVSQKVEHGAELRDLDVIDATCPLVSKVHNEGQRYAKKGYETILIGHEGHPEVEGTMGQIDGKVHLVGTVADADKVVVADPDKLAYVTQTTLSVDDTRGIIERLKERFPNIIGPDLKDICYATQNRQTAVRQMAKLCDLLLVVGAKNSSNSNRLREIGAEIGIDSYLIDDASLLDASWIEGRKSIGLTAGASAPEVLVQGVIDRLRELAEIDVQPLDGVIENVNFRLPRRLMQDQPQGAVA